MIYAFFIGAYLEASIYTGVAVASTAYHVCDTSITCFGLSHVVFELVDHIMAQNAVSWTLIYFLAFDHPRYRGDYYAERDIFRIFMWIMHLYLALFDHTNNMLYFVIVGAYLVIVLYKIAVADDFHLYPEDYRWSYLISAFALFGGSMIFYLFMADSEYWWTHSIWHTIAFIGLLLILMSRHHDTFEYHPVHGDTPKQREKRSREKIGRAKRAVGTIFDAINKRMTRPSPAAEDTERLLEKMERGQSLSSPSDEEQETATTGSYESDDSVGSYDSTESSMSHRSQPRSVIPRGSFSSNSRTQTKWKRSKSRHNT